MVSILKLIFVACHTAVAAPVIVATAAVDQRWAYRLCQRWAQVNLFVCGARVHTRRLGDLDPTCAYVFMSNHRSQFDILALVAALPDFQLRWVAKQELTRIPIFGWALRHTGHIIVDRNDHAQAVASLRAASAQAKDGVSVVIFPEGTRAAPDDLLPLKKGGFMLALDAELSIVPVAVLGSDQVLPRDSWLVSPGDIEVVVGNPIPVTGQDRDELMRGVRAFLVRELDAPSPAPRRHAVVAEAT